MDSNSSSINVNTICAICYDNIVSQAIHEEEKEKILDCSHIFHKECIGEWLKQKHNCPVCRAHVEGHMAEAPRAEMALEEIIAVPDSRTSFTKALSVVRYTIRDIRNFRRLNLNDNSEASGTVNKVNTITSRFFKW